MISVFAVRNNGWGGTDGVDYFQPLSGVSTGLSTASTNSVFVIPCDGKFKNFRVKFDSALTASQAIAYSLNVNGTDTLLATVDASGSTKYNRVDEISVVEGDLVCYKCVSTGGADAESEHHWINIEFESEMAAIMGCNSSAKIGNTTSYIPVQHAWVAAWTTTNSNGDGYFSCDGTIKNFKVVLSAAPSTGSSRIIKILNGFTTLGTVTISDEETTGSISLNTAVIQGYRTRLEYSVSGTPAAAWASHSLKFAPTVGGSFPLMFTEFDSASTSASEFSYLMGPKFWLNTHVQRTVPLQREKILKNFYVRVQTAPGAGKSWTFSIVDYSGNPTGISATISGTSTSATDNTNEYAISEGEEFSLKCTPSGTPTAMGSNYASINVFADVLPGTNTTGTNTGKILSPVILDSVEDGLIESIQKVWMDTYTFTSAIPSGTTIDIAVIPKNKKISSVELFFPELSTGASGTGTTIAIGVRNNPTATGSTLLLNAGEACAGVKKLSANSSTGLYSSLTGSTNRIYLEFGRIATATTAGTLFSVVRYT